VRNLVAMGSGCCQNTGIFQNGSRRHLGFWKYQNFNGQKGQSGKTTNFVTISRTIAEIWRFFDFSKIAAVRHVGFVLCMIEPPTKGIWWSLSLCKIWLESML